MIACAMPTTVGFVEQLLHKNQGMETWEVFCRMKVSKMNSETNIVDWAPTKMVMPSSGIQYIGLVGGGGGGL